MGFDWTAYIQTAKVEIRERLQALNDGLLRLESDAEDASVIDEVFRHAHSIKGSGQMVGLDMVSRVAHGLEDVLGAVRSGKLGVSADLLDVAFQALDGIEQILEDSPGEDALRRAEALACHLEGIGAGAAVTSFAAGPAIAGRNTVPSPVEAGEPAGLSAVRPETEATEDTAGSPEPEKAVDTVTSSRPPEPDTAEKPGKAASPGAAAEMMRVPRDRVDRILGLAGEMATLEQQERTLLASLRAMQVSLRRIGVSDGNGSGSPAGETAASLSDASALMNSMVRTARRLATARAILGREMRDAAMDLRLLPVSALFERFPRPVRDLARTAGKEVRLAIEGEETRLDKKVLDELYDPLLHLLRNALDHGIESPVERVAAGKPSLGAVTLRAEPHGRTVWIQVADDGRGISIEQVRKAACDRALFTPAEAAALSDDQALQLLFRPGFSTAAQVSAVSGRGVGLDVVYSNVRELKGVVRLENRPGEGTLFTLEIPLTLATTRVLLFECVGRVYAVPGTLVRGVTDIGAGKTQGACGQRTMAWNGRTVPLWYLDAVLGVTRPHKGDRRRVVLLAASGRTAGLVVDRLLDEEEVVLKPLGALLERAQLVSAGTVLGDGRVALLLDVDALASAASRARTEDRAGGVAGSGPQKRTILLADDALTTREIERAILETAGYEVTAAMDGQEAWERLAQRTFDLVVTDVEMPRMDGFGLTKRITSDARTSHIPVVIITSLAKEEDRRRGMEVGAAAYIVKSAFDQENLLDLIERLIG